MPTVYADDKRYGAVKITKRGKRWAVYPLEKVRCKRITKSYGKTTFTGCKFDWERKARETFPYPPFEKKDVSSTPRPLLPFISKWRPNLIRQV